MWYGCFANFICNVLSQPKNACGVGSTKLQLESREYLLLIVCLTLNLWRVLVNCYTFYFSYVFSTHHVPYIANKEERSGYAWVTWTCQKDCKIFYLIYGFHSQIKKCNSKQTFSHKEFIEKLPRFLVSFVLHIIHECFYKLTQPLSLLQA